MNNISKGLHSCGICGRLPCDPKCVHNIINKRTKYNVGLLLDEPLSPIGNASCSHKTAAKRPACANVVNFHSGACTQRLNTNHVSQNSCSSCVSASYFHSTSNGCV